MVKLNLKYFLVSVILFITEIIIAIYADGWIRSYLGDVLVVILIYTSIKSVFNFGVVPSAISVLLFSFIIEFAQYFKLVNHLGLQHNKWAVIIIGNTFHQLDLLSYFIGIVLVVFGESVINRNK